MAFYVRIGGLERDFGHAYIAAAYASDSATTVTYEGYGLSTTVTVASAGFSSFSFASVGRLAPSVASLRVLAPAVPYALAEPTIIGETVLGIAAGGIVAYQLADSVINYFSRNKGERRKAAKPSGTSNPWKHTRPHPTDPTKIIYKDPHTGKQIIKPKPKDYPE